MTKPQIRLILGQLLIVVASAAAITCPVSTCMPNDPNLQVGWLNSSTSATLVAGLSMTIFPFDNHGMLRQDISGQLSVVDIIEMKPLPGQPCYYEYDLPGDAIAAGAAARSLNISMLCCEMSYVEDQLILGVNRKAWVVTATRPDWPANFSLVVEVSMVNQSVSIPFPSSAYVPSPYSYDYVAGGVKASCRMYNWPWITDEQPEMNYGNTWHQFFFSSSFAAPLNVPGTVTLAEAYNEILLDVNSTTALSNTFIEFLQVYELDGVPYSSVLNTVPNLSIPFYNSFSIPATLMMCYNYQSLVPRYANLTYDPSLNCLFDPGSTPPPPGTPPSKNPNTLNPAAYIVPVAAAAALIIVVGGYLYWKHSKSWKPNKSTVKTVTSGVSGPSRSQDIETHANSQPARPQADTETPVNTEEEAPGSNWKPIHHPSTVVSRS